MHGKIGQNEPGNEIMAGQIRRSVFDWNQLQLFLRVARSGTLTAAAAQLGITQPTAGRQLRELERATSTTLFQRSHGGLRLTEAGEAMLVHAERIEEETLQLERRLLLGDRSLDGMVRISTSDWFASRVLARPLAQLAARHSELTIELVADFRFVSLHRREADIVFRFAAFDEADIVQRRFAHIRYGAYIAPSYRDEMGDPRASNDGSGHHLISMDSALGRAADLSWMRQRWPKARLAFRSNNREAQAAACEDGLGIAVLPRILGNAFALTLIPELDPPGRDIWLGFHRDVRAAHRIRVIVDQLSEVIGTEI